MQSERLRRDTARQHAVLQQKAAGEAPLHEPPHACVLIHVDVAQASIPKHHRIFAPSVLLESMRKAEAHHVLSVMHQAGMSVCLDQLVEGVSSVAHISCVPAAHQAACPSPSYPWVRFRLSCLSAPFTSQTQCHSLTGAAGARAGARKEEEEEEKEEV